MPIKLETTGSHDYVGWAAALRAKWLDTKVADLTAEELGCLEANRKTSALLVLFDNKLAAEKLAADPALTPPPPVLDGTTAEPKAEAAEEDHDVITRIDKWRFVLVQKESVDLVLRNHMLKVPM